jgi:hypothetical protein
MWTFSKATAQKEEIHRICGLEWLKSKDALNKVLTRDLVVWIFQALSIESSLYKQPATITASISSMSSLDESLQIFSCTLLDAIRTRVF